MAAGERTTGGVPGPDQDPVVVEQHAVERLYGRLDELRRRTAADLAQVRRTVATGTHQSRSERDAFAVLYESRLSQLWAVEDRLCFGRLDLTGGENLYVGRVGLADDDQTRMLVDWRASAAQPFYQATAASPGDVVRRRHLVTRGRTVTAVEDDVLDMTGLSDADRASLSGEGALLAAVTSQRTGRMGDIVATIQAEQDRIIRAEPGGVLVVQGGPGTGKTAVALHRAAYLLYTYRERLARSGVLVVGPSPVFLRYIERVLPSLGETGVVMLTAGQLLPGVDATATDEPEVARLKGDVRMADVIAAAIAARQRVPDKPQRLQVEGTRVVLTPRAVAAARQKARRSGKPHNEARVVFVKDLLLHLADQMARALGTRLDADERGDAIADLRAAVDVRRAVNLAWMPLDPRGVLARLLSNPDELAAAGPWLTTREVAALVRPRDAPVTVDDVPLLDEAAELLGEGDVGVSAEEREAQRQRREELEYARGVLEMTGSGGMVSAEQLADRFGESGAELTLSERAGSDRTWAFAHVVVDEAQELSPMMWRLLARRNPSRSMTVVGDLAQTRSAAGADTWEQVLDPFAEGRWRREVLTVNYRTPAQAMRAATAVMEAAGIDVVPATSVREGTWPPTSTRLDVDDLPAVVAAVAEEAEAVSGGRLAVIAAEPRLPELADALATALGGLVVAAGPRGLDAPVAVMSVADCKGLEFDGVVVLEPAEIVASGRRGVNDLYVALTRPTQRLRVLHCEPLPAGLADTLTPT